MKSKYLSLALVGCMALFTACGDKLDIAQHGALNYDTYYKTDVEAETAVTAIYLEVRELEYNYKMGKNMLSDDFWAGGGARNDNSDLEQLNEYTFGTDQAFLQGMFQSYYRIVYKANVVLGHVPEETPVQRKMRAEAKVFRAFAYFDLISMWGNPPLVDHELTSSEYAQPNGKTEELWTLVENDLKEAIESGLLSQKSGLNDKDTWRVTKQFAQALLGKAYLWQKKNSEAASVLNQVIDSKLYKLYDGNYEDIIAHTNKYSTESLFESNRVNDLNNTGDNWSLYYTMIHWRTDKMNVTSDLSDTGWGFCVPQKGLYDAFVAEEGENGYRLTQTMKTYEQIKDMGNSVKLGSTIINEGYFMWKTRVTRDELQGFWGFVTNNPRWMRYSEVLLLAAEANLAAGNTELADKYLNEVRTRAQLSSKSGVKLQDIMAEKRLELCGECVRYQDMIRWGIAESTLKNQGEKCPELDSNGNVTYKIYNSQGKYGFKAGKNELLPYPGTEIRLNPAIVQNPGWGTSQNADDEEEGETN